MRWSASYYSQLIGLRCPTAGVSEQAEEAGLLGSQAIAQYYEKEGYTVRAMMQLDMTMWAGYAEQSASVTVSGCGCAYACPTCPFCADWNVIATVWCMCACVRA